MGAGIGSVTGYFGKCSSGACPLTATPFRGAAYGGVLGLLLAIGMGSSGSHDSGHGAEARTNPGGSTTQGLGAVAQQADERVAAALVHIDGSSDFRTRILQAKVPSLVDFYSESCPPCRALGPTIDKLAERYRGRAVVSKVKLDGGKNGDLARRYGIRAIPAVLFFSDGKEIERYVGLREEADYAAVLDRLAEAATDLSSQDANGTDAAVSGPTNATTKENSNANL